MSRGGFLEPAPALGPSAERDLADLHAGRLHARLAWAEYKLVACRADGPIGPEPAEDADGDERTRHVFHPRRWRIEGPGLFSQICHDWPEVPCTLYEAERIAQALQRAHEAGKRAKSREVLDALGAK